MMYNTDTSHSGFDDASVGLHITVGVVSIYNTLLQRLITHNSMCYAFCLSILMITRDKLYSHRRIILY